MGISVGGIVSGLDTEALVEDLVNAYSTPKVVMEDQLEDLEEAQEAFAGLTNRLEDLQAALDDLASVGEFQSWSTATSDAGVVGVSASEGAIPGSYSVLVNALASAETEVSQGYADAESEGVLGTGTLSITYGGTTTELTLDGTETLEDIADTINEQVDGVTAYIMDTGDATNPYRLVIAGEDTGAVNSITVDTAALSGGTAPSFTETTTAADAEVELNGVTITDSDNELTAVPGLTFSLESVSATAVEVTVAADVDGMADKVQAFVDAYNDVISYIDQQSAYNTDEDIKGPFVADSLVSSVQRSLSSVIVDMYAAGTFTGLAQLGVSTEQSGELAFDAAEFADAYAEDPDGVVSLFTDSTDGFTTAMDAVLETLLDEDDGSLANRDESLAEEIETTQERIEQFDEQMDAYEARLWDQFTAMELALADLEAASSALSALFTDTTTSE